MNKRKKVLWLVSWYPNKYDAFDGDFIQRHARAAALYDDVTVLFIVQLPEQKESEVAERCETGLVERIVYLPKKKGLTGKLLNIYRWRKAGRQAATDLIKKWHPQMVHVHVPWKAGLIALFLKKKYKLPYVVTEHWGIYNEVVADRVHTRSLLFRTLLKRIYKEAERVVSVSRFLGEGINKTLLRKDFVVIPNVVDTSLFFLPDRRSSRFTFLHVSNMVPLKNVEGILSAFESFLVKTGSGAQLVFVGNRTDRYVRLAKQWKLLNNAVFFRGEIPYSEVAGQMQQAHALVLNSDMENSPCVIGEALCCGLPVIATRVGGIPELVSSRNAILVPPRDTEALTTAFWQMEKNYGQFSPETIAASAAAKFALPAVGKELHQLYTLSGRVG